MYDDASDIERCYDGEERGGACERSDGSGTMMRHVLLISLGPVQDFIASARRCRDLWFGSWVLSELAKAAAAGVVEALGGDKDAIQALVFPAVQDRLALEDGSAMSVANKLVVRVAGDAERVRLVAQEGRKRMNARLAVIRDEAFKRIGRQDPKRKERFFEDIAQNQVDELFEYVWVAAAEADGKEAYAVARREAEWLLSGRKNIHQWSQPPWALEGRGDGVPKSSLDGIRESVLHENIYDRPITGLQRAPSLKPEQRRAWYGVHGSERLCGVGLLKRWGVRHDAVGRRRIERFFSTPHIAAIPLRCGIGDDLQRDLDLKDAWKRLQEAAGPAVEDLGIVPGQEPGFFGNIDGAILFRERLAETLEDCGYRRDSIETERALEALREFLRQAGRGEPVPYYAIVVADGDSMGRVIDNQTTYEAHRELSTALASFAGKAREIVENHNGCLIYSGGDDVLAFLPLHQAIECARALAQTFAKNLEKWKTADGGHATLSAGLGIVHYIDSMGAALDVAREAEKEAKRHPGKNALAVALDKRSGGRTLICDHWESITERLLELVKLHIAEAIPDKAGHELAELSLIANGALPDDLKAIRAIQRSEAVRILGRKRAQQGEKAIDKDTLGKLTLYLRDDPAMLGQEIGIAGEIAKAKKQAAPRGKEGG